MTWEKIVCGGKEDDPVRRLEDPYRSIVSVVFKIKCHVIRYETSNDFKVRTLSFN